MKSSTAMKTRIESEPTTTEYTLIFPKEKRGTLREWLLLQLVHVGYETEDIENFIYGRFPRMVKIRAYVEETDEMRILLNAYLEANGVKLGDPEEAVK